MDLLQEVETILKINNRKKRIAAIDSLDSVFERGRFLKTEDVGKAAALLLNAALMTQYKEEKSVLLYVLGEAIKCNDISEYIDWEAIISLMPHLSGENLDCTLEMVGWSKRREYIPFLERYVDDQDLSRQMTALDAISQIWWDLSNHDPVVKEQLQVPTRGLLWFLVLNPKKHQVPSAEIQEQILQYRNEMLKNMNAWFEKNN